MEGTDSNGAQAPQRYRLKAGATLEFTPNAGLLWFSDGMLGSSVPFCAEMAARYIEPVSDEPTPLGDAWVPIALHEQIVADRDAEIERLKQQLRESEAGADALDKKLESLAPHGTCACSFDSLDDLCAHHSPQLMAAQAAIEREGREVCCLLVAEFESFWPCFGDNELFERIKDKLNRAYAEREAEREKGGQHGATEG